MHICLKCTQFLKINAGNSLSVAMSSNITQWIENTISRPQSKLNKLKTVIITDTDLN